MYDILYAAAEKLGREYGCTFDTGYYPKIRLWEEWWQGFVPEVHRFVQYGVDGRRIERRIYSMHMGKRICEDWASILLNERTTISVGHRGSGLFLQGQDGTGGVFGKTKFWRQGNELVEKAFALGTGAFVLRVKGMRRTGGGSVVPDPSACVGIEYVTAKQILPISVENGEITEAAFVSGYVRRGKTYAYIETHTKNALGNYVIRNRFYELHEGTLTERKLPSGVAETLDTGSGRRWFSIVRPNIANNMDAPDGMGISVYGNAIDALEGVDLAYNNTNRDIYLGGKKVFYNKALLQRGADGSYISPDDVIQQLFTQLGDDGDFDKSEMIQEFNPSLRSQENRDSVQAQLDYLSFLCGLGTHRYQFNGTSVIRTATEYVGNKQELIQMAAKHYVLMEEAVKNLCGGILYIGREFCGADADPDAEITLNFENSYIINKDDERNCDREDIRLGLMSPAEYRMKWYGDTEDEAKSYEASMRSFEPENI